MTFSTQAIVDEINAHWVPVWESVSPVKKATFDLGNGESLSGTISGEIALFFCTPDGRTFDILPALQSPARVLAALRDARKFYEETQANESATWQRLLAQDSAPDAIPYERARAMRDEARAKLRARRKAADEATRTLSEMVFSKTLMVAEPEEITVVEPGGLELYAGMIREMLIFNLYREPMEYRDQLFVDIFDQPLEGGHYVFGPESLEPLSVSQ